MPAPRTAPDAGGRPPAALPARRADQAPRRHASPPSSWLSRLPWSPGIGVATPPFDGLRGLSLDVLTALRWQRSATRTRPPSSPAVVVAIDEETYRTPPFEGTPSVTWTREIGRVLTAIIEGGAKVVGFDIIFPTSIEQSDMPFGDETLGARVRGFDRDYLRALALGARATASSCSARSSITTSRSALAGPAHRRRPAAQHPRAQRLQRCRRRRPPPAAVLHRRWRAACRRWPSSWRARAHQRAGVRRRRRPDARRATRPGAVPDTMTLNFAGGADDIPTYSLADLRACAEKGDTDFFSRALRRQGRAASARCSMSRTASSPRSASPPASEGARAPRCALPAPAGRAAVRARHDRRRLCPRHRRQQSHPRATPSTELGRWPVVAAIAFVLRAAGRVAACRWRRLGAALAWLGVAAVWTACRDRVVFRAALALPLLEPLLAALAALAPTIGYRFMVADRDKRFLRQSFALYLAPASSTSMLASSRPPALGGEMRDGHHVLLRRRGFLDRSRSRCTPHELVALMNDYLSAMTDIIEERRRLRRQVHRRRHRGGVRRAGSTIPDHATQRGARRAALPRAAGGAQRQRRAFQGAPGWATASGSIPARRWSATSARAGASTTR